MLNELPYNKLGSENHEKYKQYNLKRIGNELLGLRRTHMAFKVMQPNGSETS